MVSFAPPSGRTTSVPTRGAAGVIIYSDPYDDAKKLAGEHVEISGKKFTKPGVASIVVSGTKAQ